jgi:deoxycytidylate deaminase
MDEVWLDVVGYEGIYRVSNKGRIQSLHYTQVMLAPVDNGQKLSVVLSKDGIKTNRAIHRLVAEAFLINDNPQEKIQVNHKDNNHKNNCVDNLEWCTPSHNTKHAYENGYNGKSKRIHQYSLDGDYLGTYYSVREASRVTGIQLSAISGVARHERKTAGGYTWTYDMPKEHVFMNFAIDLSNLSKCTQRGVAAIITDRKLMQVYSIGLNGGPVNGVDCLCQLHGKETCIHAETQAIAKMSTTDKEKVIFTTLSPCITCASLIINSGFIKVYYSEDWKDNPGLKLLRAAGIQVVKV